MDDLEIKKLATILNLKNRESFRSYKTENLNTGSIRLNILDLLKTVGISKQKQLNDFCFEINKFWYGDSCKSEIEIEINKIGICQNVNI